MVNVFLSTVVTILFWMHSLVVGVCVLSIGDSGNALHGWSEWYVVIVYVLTAGVLIVHALDRCLATKNVGIVLLSVIFTGVPAYVGLGASLCLFVNDFVSHRLAEDVILCLVLGVMPFAVAYSCLKDRFILKMAGLGLLLGGIIGVLRAGSRR